MENYIKLNKDAIFEEANRLKAQNQFYSDKLFQALGGENLNRIFPKMEITSIMKSIVNNHKLFYAFEDDGLDILEGFLNNKVTKPIGVFYNIRPTYILSLSPEEQEKMAKAVSEGNEDLEEVLKYLWKQNISTIACGGKSNPGYLYLEVPLTDIRSISVFKSLCEKKHFEISTNFYYEPQSKESTLSLTVYGPPEQLYREILSEFHATEQTDYSNSFDRSLFNEINSNINLIVEVIKSQQTNGLSPEEVYKLLVESAEAHRQQYEELQQRYDKLSENYSSLQERFCEVKGFVVQKIGKIPFLGRKVISLLNDALKDKALPPAKSKTNGKDTDLIH